MSRKKKTVVKLQNKTNERLFYLDDGKLDSKNSVKSAICYWVTCEILNDFALHNDNLEVLIDHPAAQHTFQIGRIVSPGISPVYENGKLKEYRISSLNHVYFLEDTADALKALLKKWGKPVKEFSVAIGRLQGPVYENDCTYVVYSEEDFIAADVKPKDRGEQIMNLINANRKGFLGKGEKNGIERYLTAMKKLTEKGLTASEIEELNVDELRNVIANKRKKVVAT